jgi:Ca-activated chloride channel family protein
MEMKECNTDWRLERWISFFLSLLFLLPFVARGESAPGEEPLHLTTINQEQGAGLLLKTATAGVYAEAPVVSSEVSITVTGPLIRTTVRQTFHNPTGRCVEGLYVFPLPEMSAVDSLKMTIGSRVIVGEVREREEAKKEYEKARAEGRKAALVEQSRPNIFTTSVSGLLAGENAVIEIQYQETARYENGEYRLRFPMVVAPRYNPAQTSAQGGFPTPPDSGRNAAATSPLSLTVDLRPGYALRDIRSEHHKIAHQTVGNDHYHVQLDESAVSGEHDFELAWLPDLGSDPAATVLTEQVDGETYALLLVTPPARTPVALPREVIFIIDSSGSMQGASMEQAKMSLLLAGDDLRPGDLFNIIDFDSVARPLFDASRPVDGGSVGEAKHFVDGIDADGGTEMLKAIQLALPARQSVPGMVRQVVFMTDGQVGNEQELFSYIHDNLGDSRLFTVGIGSAPNSHFMRNAARFGRGTFTYIGDVQQVKERMGELFAKLGSPVMTSIDVRSSDPSAELWPARVPDLYSGEPLVVAVRLKDPLATLGIGGKIGEESWSTRQSLTAPVPDSGIGKLWARQKIESLMDGLSEGVDAQKVRSDVIAVALRHHLVSQYTSLVAVDHTPAGLGGAACQPEAMPVSQPGAGAGNGALPQTATPAVMLLLAGWFLMMLGLAAARLGW